MVEVYQFQFFEPARIHQSFLAGC